MKIKYFGIVNNQGGYIFSKSAKVVRQYVAQLKSEGYKQIGLLSVQEVAPNFEHEFFDEFNTYLETGE